jgi:YHS domain-containing protein
VPTCTLRLAPRAAVVLWLACWLASPARAAAAPADDPRRLLEVDAVELVDHGREVAGLSDLSLTRDGITYLFATREHLVAFEREPKRYEVQYGGACARMGPLSGACGTEVRAVHRDRLYVFASPQCRDAFLAAPESLLESDDPVPVADVASRQRGRALVDRAADALGRPGAVDAVRSCVERASRTELSDGREHRVIEETWLGFVRGAPLADHLRRDTTRDGSRRGAIVAEGRGVAHTQGHREALVASQQRAFEKELGRHPLAVLRNRRAPGAVLVHTGAGELDGVPVELVAVALRGRTTTLAIDPATGMLLALRYRGRSEDARFAELEVRLSNWRQVGALRLPFTRTVTADGRPQPALSTTLDAIVLDGPLAPDVFRTFN